MKIEKRLEYKASANKKETDVYLYGVIGSWSLSAKEVKNILDQIKTETINIHINSNGGDVFESVAISNLLRQHNAKINIHIDAMAASGASLIAMSGNKIYMPKNAMMMIHNAWTFAAGNAKELRKVANDLEKVDTVVTETYSARFVGEKNELEKLLAEETFLTAEECKALGFCDEVLDLSDNGKDDGESSAVENSSVDSILNKYITGYSASADKAQKINETKEMRSQFAASIMEQFLNNLQKKENE